MSGITGEKRVQQNFSKKVGLFEAKVIAINPTEEEYKEVLGLELKEDSKATEYLGTNEHGNDFLRVDVWVEDVKTSKSESPERYKLVFFLENKERENKDLTKNSTLTTLVHLLGQMTQTIFLIGLKNGNTGLPLQEKKSFMHS